MEKQGKPSRELATIWTCLGEVKEHHAALAGSGFVIAASWLVEVYGGGLDERVARLLPVPVASWLGSHQVLVVLVVAALFPALYLAWRKKHFEVLSLREELTKAAESKGPPEKTLADFFAPGLVLEYHQQTYGPVRTPQNVHLHQFKVRINRSAKSILFQCLDPLSGATAQASESPEHFLTIHWQGNWAEAIFRDPDSARGALLEMELTSVSPLRLDEVVIRDSQMP